jgi:peptidoglycan DL-endopeptidase CwlO
VSYVDGYTGVLAEISQIQSVFSSVSASAPPSGFEAVLQQVSSLSALAGSPAPASPGTPDLSGSFGYPLEEGDPIPAGTGSSGAPGGGISAGPSGSSTTAGAAGAATGYQLANAMTSLTGQNAAPWSAQSGDVQTAAAGSGPSSQAGGSSDSSSFGASVVADAQKYLGVPYQWGGTNPAQGVDCSGLVQDVFGDLGVSLPRTSQEQANVGVAVPSVAAAQPGDLVFFPGTDGTASAPGHVGIYIGNGQMIDAPYTGADVRVDPVGDPTAIRRVSGPSTSADGEQLSTVSSAGTYPSAGAGSATSPGVITSGASGTSAGSGTGSTSGSGTGSTAGSGTGSTAGDGALGGPASLPTSTGGSYGDDFASAAASTGVPVSLLNAVASTESSFQPGAVSSAGAEGLMQLMPSTAASLGVNPFNPSQAVNAAAELLSNYHQQFGSWSLALAAYNAGPAAVQAYSGVPPYSQTQNYVQTVLSRAGMEGQ